MLRTLSLSFLAASFYSPSPDSAVYKFAEFDGGPVSALGPSAFPVVSQRLMVVFFTHCCRCQCHGNLEIPHSVAYSHSCFLNHTYAHNFVLNFWSSLTPLLLGFCCLLFPVPRAAFSCCIREHLCLLTMLLRISEDSFGCIGGSLLRQVAGKLCAVDRVTACPVWLYKNSQASKIHLIVNSFLYG